MRGNPSGSGGACGPGLDDEVDDLAGDVVGQAEECAGDDHEAYDDRCRLADLPTIRPLYSLELAPASSQEVEDPVALAGLLGFDGPPARAAAGANELGAFGDVAVGDRLLLFVGGAPLVGLLGRVDAILEPLECLLAGLDVGFPC